MRLTFAKKLIVSYLFVVAVTLLITGVYLTGRLKANLMTHVEKSMSAQTLLLRDLLLPIVLHPSGKHPYQAWVMEHGRQLGCRVTVIRADGVVMGDSDRSPDELSGMDNHLTRPEVQAALSSGTGESMRYSSTLHSNMLYLAVPVTLPNSARSWGVLRIALPLTEVRRRISSFQADLLKAGAAALAVAFLVALIMVRKTSRPLEILAETARSIHAGQLPGRINVASSDEFEEVAGSFSNLSARIQEKIQELTQERTQLAAILSTLVEGVIALDHEGRVLLINPSAEALFGVQSTEVKGRPVLEVLRQNALHTVIQETLRKNKSVSQEIAIHFPHERSLLVQALPVPYGEGRTGVLAALQDITELRKLERVRQEFVANVSHELKTPLTAIKGYVETLLDGALEDKAHNQEFLKIIGDHTRRLSLLIDDVLDLSAIEAKRVEYRFEAVSLADVTARLIKGLAPMAKAKDVKIDNKLSEKLPKVRADRDKLAQIFMNLLDNAIKFNKTGGQVVITARGDNGTVAVSIQDSGAGIAAEDLPRIFERFYRADKARSHDVAGTGLGLAIVKHLVEAHQGTVVAQSKPSEGSTFTFTLPTA